MTSARIPPRLAGPPARFRLSSAAELEANPSGRRGVASQPNLVRSVYGTARNFPRLVHPTLLCEDRLAAIHRSPNVGQTVLWIRLYFYTSWPNLDSLSKG